MSSITELLRKLVNEEIEKLEEQGDVKFDIRQRQRDADALKQIAAKQAAPTADAKAQAAARKLTNQQLAQRIKRMQSSKESGGLTAGGDLLLKALKGEAARRAATRAKIVAHVCRDLLPKNGAIKGLDEEGDTITIHWKGKGSTPAKFKSADIGDMNLFSKQIELKCGKLAKGTGASAGRGKRARKTRSITMLIQRKLNDFANVAGVPGLKPTRRAKDGVDGILGTGTLTLIKQVLGNIPQLKNKWAARRNAGKINKMLSDKYEKENIAAKVDTDEHWR